MGFMGLFDIFSNSEKKEAKNETTNQIVTNISNEIHDILSANDLVVGFCAANKNSTCFGFLRCEDNGEVCLNSNFFNTSNLQIDAEKFEFVREKIKEFINYIFDGEYIFINPNLEFINLLLYATHEEVLNYIKNNNPHQIIADNIKRVDEKGNINKKRIFHLYKSIKISQVNEQGEGTIEFNPMTFDEFKGLFGENSNFEINKNDFFYGMWKDNTILASVELIRYGLDSIYSNIEKELQNKGGNTRDLLNGVKIGYKIKMPKNAKDDSLEEKINLTVKRKPKIDKNGIADLKQLETVIPEINTGVTFLEYTEGESGYYGIALNGSPIKENIQIEPKKINYHSIIHSGESFIETREQNGKIVFITKENLYVTKKGDLANKGTLDFSKDIKIRSNIDSVSRNMILTNPGVITLSNTITSPFGIECESLRFLSGEIYGFIRCKKDINIGSARISGAEIFSLGGNISIGSEKNKISLLSGTKITAPNGKIVIHGNVEHCIIMGDDIEVEGKATSCTIIGKRIKIDEVDKDSQIVGGNITVSRNHPSNSNYIIVVSNAINGRENQLKFLESRKQTAKDNEGVEIQKSIDMLKKMETFFKRVYGTEESNILAIDHFSSSDRDLTTIQILSHSFSYSDNPLENYMDLKFLYSMIQKDSKDFINISSKFSKSKVGLSLGKALELLQNHYLGENGPKGIRSDLRRKVITKQTIPVQYNLNSQGTLTELSERGCVFNVGKEITGINKGDVINISFKYTDGKINEVISSPFLVVSNEGSKIVGIFLFAGVETKLSRIISALDIPQ